MEKPFWLSVDLSSANGSLAIHEVVNRRPPCLIAESTVTENGQHSEAFLPALQGRLKASGIQFPQFQKLITVSGPGSFTGLRIAFASLKAIAMAHGIPIETVGASEARALAWRKSNASPPCDNIAVLTHISLNRFVDARFKVTSGGIKLLSEKIESADTCGPSREPTLFLLDRQIPRTLVTAGNLIRVEEFPLTARFLAEALEEAATRKAYPSLAEWIVASPDYFGDTKYKA